MGEIGAADECEEREEEHEGFEEPGETGGPAEAAEESTGGPEAPEVDPSPETSLPEAGTGEPLFSEADLPPETPPSEEVPNDPVIPETLSAAPLSEAARETGAQTGFREEESIHFVNQILATELPSPLLSAEDTLTKIENDYDRALEQILGENGKYMSDATRDRAAGSCVIGACVPTGNELGVYRSDGLGGVPTIEIMTRDPEIIHSTVQHEMNHRTANESHIVVPDQYGHTIYLNSGFYHSGFYHSNITGRDLEIPGFTAHGKGLDEGFTQHLVIEQITHQDAAKGEAAANENCYAAATALAAQMEAILGPDVCRSAYYGGKTGALTTEFDALAGRDGAFREFESWLDMTLSEDQAERDEAAARAMDILADLTERSGK